MFSGFLYLLLLWCEPPNTPQTPPCFQTYDKVNCSHFSLSLSLHSSLCLCVFVSFPEPLSHSCSQGLSHSLSLLFSVMPTADVNPHTFMYVVIHLFSIDLLMWFLHWTTHCYHKHGLKCCCTLAEIKTLSQSHCLPHSIFTDLVFLAPFKGSTTFFTVDFSSAIFQRIHFTVWTIKLNIILYNPGCV